MVQEPLPDGVDASRLPPGQYSTKRFPVLHVGYTPKVKLEKWDFKVDGLVKTPVSWSFEEMTSLPGTDRVFDIHCVIKWSKFDTRWEGISVTEVFARLEFLPEATHVPDRVLVREAGKGLPPPGPRSVGYDTRQSV